MTPVETFLDRIHWNNRNTAVLSDCQQVFLLIFKMDISEDEKEFAWKTLSERAPFIAYVMLGINNGIWKPKDPNTIMELLWGFATSSDVHSKKKLSDAITLAALMGRKLPGQMVNQIRASDEIEQIIKRSFKNLELLSYRERNFLALIKTLYLITDPLDIENYLHFLRANFTNEGIEDEAYHLAVQTIRDGHFKLFYLIKKAYSLEYEKIQLSADDIFDGLKTSDSRSVFRGALVYYRFLSFCIDDEYARLKKWYSDVCSIPSDDRENLRFLYICKTLQLKNDNPDDLLSEMHINLLHFPTVSVEESWLLIREYRWVVYTLIRDGHIGWCRSFLEKTYAYNVDRYICGERVRSPYREEAGIRNLFPGIDEKSILRSLYESNCSIETIVLIYMNSFLRGIVGFAQFVQEMCERFGHNPALNEITKYKIGGAIRYDVERKINYLRPNTVIKRWNDIARDKFFLSKESSEALLKKGVPDGSWLAFQLDSYNSENKVFRFSVMGFADQRLDSLVSLFSDIERNHSVPDSLDGEVSKINIALVERDSEAFAELCVKELSMLLSFCRERDRLFDLMERTRKANYFAYRPERNSTAAREIVFHSPSYNEIPSLWNTLYKSSLNVMDCFSIYRNTILRHKYCLSQFIEHFDEDDNDCYSVFWGTIGVLNGYVERGFARKEGTDDTALMFVRPSEFKKSKRVRGEKMYDRFVMEVPLYGQSTTSFKKENGIKENRPVRFEIDSYIGNGVFNVKNIKFLERE